MSRATLAEGKAELFALLAANVKGEPTFAAAGVDTASVRVYDHERPTYDFPVNVTIAFGGSDADFWRLHVRLYVSTARMDAKTAQDQMDLLIPAIEAKIASNGGFDPNGWTPLDWAEDLDALVAVCEVEFGREDVVV